MAPLSGRMMMALVPDGANHDHDAQHFAQDQLNRLLRMVEHDDSIIR